MSRKSLSFLAALAVTAVVLPGAAQANCASQEAELQQWINSATVRMQGAGICQSARISRDLWTRASRFWEACPINDPTGENAQNAQRAIRESQATMAAACTNY